MNAADSFGRFTRGYRTMECASRAQQCACRAQEPENPLPLLRSWTRGDSADAKTRHLMLFQTDQRLRLAETNVRPRLILAGNPPATGYIRGSVATNRRAARSFQIQAR